MTLFRLTKRNIFAFYENVSLEKILTMYIFLYNM